MIPSMQPEAILIDWDGTLSHSKFWDGQTEFEPATKTRCTDFLFGGDGELARRWMLGEATATEAVGVVAEALALDAAVLLRALRRSCEQMRLVDPGILATVQQLRDHGVHVAIATDNMDTFTNWTVPALQLRQHFDGVISSSERQAFKRHLVDGRSPFFSEYFEQNGINPHRSVLLDDGLHNAAVQQLGMEFVHINQDNPLVRALDALVH